jgi:hypothetical protein
MEVLRTIEPRSTSAFQAYMTLQARLYGRFQARGGTCEEWSRRLAPAFRSRYGYILENTNRKTP